MQESINHNRSNFLCAALAAVVALAAPAALAAFALRNAVNVPFIDEWDWGTLIYHVRTGTLSFALLVAPHNEHRNVLPNLIFIALDRIGGWNVVRECAFSLGVLVVADIALWHVVRRNLPNARALFAFAGLSLILCGLGQWENVAVGYNIGWNLCTLATIIVPALLAHPARSTAHICAAALVAVAASFSSGQGMILWLCGYLVIALVPRAFALATAIWSIAAAATIGLYFLDYHTVAPYLAPGTIPAGWLSFVCAFLGGAVRAGSGAAQAIAFGALLLLALAAVVFASRERLRTPAGRAAAAPWLAFAAYALAGAALTAAGRRQLGIDFALESHYEAIALFLPLAIVGLTALAWPALRGKWAWGGVVAVILVSTLTVDAHGIRFLRDYAGARRAEVRAFAAGDLTAAERLAYPGNAQLPKIIDRLRDVHDGPFYGE